MDITLLKALLVLALSGILFFGRQICFLVENYFPPFLQLIGTIFLVIVAVVHIFESLRLFTFMHWGSPHSIGHYLDLSSAILGVTLFFTGFFLSMVRKER